MSRRPEPSAAEVWEERKVAAGERVRWCVGPLTIWLERLEAEWRLSWKREADVAGNAARASFERGAEAPAEALDCVRFVLRRTGERVDLAPVVADRALVVTPLTPLLVPPGEEATLYVSAPVWIDVQVGSPLRVLRQIPTVRPSDTWFGSVRDGELSYALFTHGRSRLEEMPAASHRAITPLRVHNEADEPLELDRVNLPVPFLSLYRGQAGRLWTEAVALRREEAGEMARLEVRQGAPAEAGKAQRVHEARSNAGKGRLVRAFGDWFSAWRQG